MPPPEPRDRRAWPYARMVLAAVLVLVVAAGVYARAHTSFPFRTAPRLSPTAVTTTFLVVEGLGLVFAVLLLIARRRRRRRPDDDAPWSPANRWIAAAVNLTAFVMALLLASWLVRHFRNGSRRGGLLGGFDSSAGSTHRPGLPAGAATLWLGWLCVVVFTVLVVVAVSWWQRRRARPAPAPAVAEDEALPDSGGAALRAGRRALDTSDDPRTAVIACYEAMERSLADAGLARAPAQTPEELLALARGRDALASVRAAQTLIELFGRARFSTRAVDASDVAVARSALAELVADTPDRARAR
ncbi:MAG TPA: DUF4129 domain-containing protein [Streptosporangiales bacterium]